MTRLSSKQIIKLADGFIRVLNLSASGGSNVVTTLITTALSTAGDNGVAVPLQVASNTAMGVVTNVTIPIFSNLTKRAIIDTAVADASSNEVYGKLTESGGVYTVSYFSLINGTETAYSFPSATAIDFLIPYRFDFERLPKNFAISYPIGDVNLPSVGSSPQASWFRESLNVTATNTISLLTKTPVSNTDVFLYVNGLEMPPYGGASADFSVTLKTITWNANNAGYNLATTDKVTVAYLTNQ
jgi:hypothetical protein